MFVTIEKQLKLISKFLNRSEFQWKAIVDDRRSIAFISWYKKAINEIKKLSSLNVLIPDNIWYSLWRWYPSINSEILEVFEKLAKVGLEIDIEVVKNKYYKKVSKNILNLYWLNFSYKETNNIKWIEKYVKIKDFSIDIHYIINNYITVIEADDNLIKDNIDLYNKKYKTYIWLKNDLKYEKNIKYRGELEKYFLDYRIFEFKNRIKFYTLLQNHWYETLDQVFSKAKINIDKINYYKNISVKDNNYTWKIHKVYNVVSSKKMIQDYIMIAENTNPEFISAFYKAKFICVETESELSHASITCKELNIPLALWAKGIFLATENGKRIEINTKIKVIYL